MLALLPVSHLAGTAAFGGRAGNVGGSNREPPDRARHVPRSFRTPGFSVVISVLF